MGSAGAEVDPPVFVGLGADDVGSLDPPEEHAARNNAPAARSTGNFLPNLTVFPHFHMAGLVIGDRA